MSWLRIFLTASSSLFIADPRFAQSLPFAVEEVPPTARLDCLAVGDVNADGIPDFVGVERSLTTYPLMVYLGSPGGGMTVAAIPVGIATPTPATPFSWAI